MPTRHRAKLPLLLAAVAVLTRTAAAGADDGTRAAASFAATVAQVERARRELAERFTAAPNAAARARVLEQARRFVITAIADRILPAWIGTPWTMANVDDGLRPDARRPHQPGAGVSCSWFVVAVLGNAGLNLGDGRAFAGGLAADLQLSLSRRRDHHRFWGLSPSALARRLVDLGDGLYLIGLVRHVGFVHVRGAAATIIHSSPDADRAVVREPVAGSAAIALSTRAGYLVTPLFTDERLIEHWLTGRAVRYQPAGARR